MLTIHNIGYQGVFSAAAARHDLGLGDSTHLLHQEDLALGRINSLKHGVLYADSVTTVSPTYAREIATPQYGMGLDGVMRARSDGVVGILNGVDYEEWNPQTDAYLPAHYRRAQSRRQGDDQEGSARAPRAGLRPRDAADRPHLPTHGAEGHRPAVRGAAAHCWPHATAVSSRSAAASHTTRSSSSGLARGFPRRVAFYRGYSEELAHLIEGGSDMFLMPSLYEPCGLNQMYSLRYGTVPIVRRTGGLADSVQLYDPHSGEGTGIVFDDFNVEAVLLGDQHGRRSLSEPPALESHRAQRPGTQDFSWEHQGAGVHCAVRAPDRLGRLTGDQGLTHARHLRRTCVPA